MSRLRRYALLALLFALVLGAGWYWTRPAVSLGLAAGVAPAGRAARLDPVEALRAE